MDAGLLRRYRKVKMDTRLIELRMAVQALPSTNKTVQLAVKSEVLRISELLDAERGLTTDAPEMTVGDSGSVFKHSTDKPARKCKHPPEYRRRGKQNSLCSKCGLFPLPPYNNGAKSE